MMPRPIVGWMALVLLVVGGLLAIASPQVGFWHQFGFGSLRMGVLLALFWFAYHQLESLPRWTLPVILVSVGLLAYLPRMFPVLLRMSPAILAVVLITMFLRPRRNRGPRAPASGQRPPRGSKP